jgi:UDP-N-acetylglucosamine 3-dehydrogenase
MATRLGLIGRGKWGRNIERTLLSLPDVSVVLIGRDEPLRRDVDGVVVASPSATHAALALPYIDAGVATFIEKPMATTVADAHRIREAAFRARCTVFVGHVHLYNPAFQAALELVKQLGTVHYVLSESANNNARTDSSVIWDWLPHDLSMGWAIFGANPLAVQAWNLTESRCSQAAVSRYLYGASSLVSMMSWLSPIRRQRMTIAGERGHLVFDDKAIQKLILHDKGGMSYPTYDSELPLTRELRCFLQSVRTGFFDASDVELGVAIVQAIDAAEASMENGGATVQNRT